ncbi:PP2C family protein-serine/threonine phosphatase [Streptomyces sp. NPDC102274]|uniref:PP2C family protein-serine/threonine phosphatase n=1 Tax=Streptomyces sp. NPDC102274 TaxID=3366151 RepID=UPI003824457E
MASKIPPLPGGALILGPLLLIVVIPIIDIWLPPDLHLAPLLVVAPTFTASFAGSRLTATIGVLTVVSQVVAGLERHSLGSERVLLEVVALAVVTVLMTVFCYLRERHHRQLARVHLISETVQSALLRPLPRRAGPLRIASECRPSEPDTHISGDLFAVARTANSTRLLIGDVRGKGLTSINRTSIMLGAFRAAAHRQSPLPELAAYLEGSVHWGLAELSLAEDDVTECFVTALLVDIPDNGSVVHCVSMGHPPALLLRDGMAIVLDTLWTAPPLGLGALGDASYTQETFPFRCGNQLLLYTDGVSEARDADGVFFPLAERAAAAVRSGNGPEELLRHLTTDLLSYTGGSLDDDMAMIAITRVPGRADPSAHVVPTQPEKGFR